MRSERIRVLRAQYCQLLLGPFSHDSNIVHLVHLVRAIGHLFHLVN
jgi:hypothetical protein